ncbi:MAG: hypothetical protein RJA70_2780, partial [Pseudomonadota bacterium]|jgi:hypothetical protein
LLGCGASSEDTEGTLRVYGGIDRDGRPITSYALESADGETVPLDIGDVSQFPALRQLRSGTRLVAQGDRAATGTLRLRHYDVVAPSSELGVVQQSLVVGEPRTRRLAVLMVHGGNPDSETPATLREKLFNAPTSVRALLQESSFGKLDIAGDVHNWIQVSPIVGCNVGQVAAEAQERAQLAGIDLTRYDHILYYFPGEASCSFGGLGEVGSPSLPVRQTWYNGWFDTFVVTHELGHNLGFWHGHALTCGNSVVSTNPGAECLMAEYGDHYDPMGNGTTHFNGYYKAAQGWIKGCGLATVPAGGEYSLTPVETATSELQVLRVPAPLSICPDSAPCYYYIEYRQPLGMFDGDTRYGTAPMHEGLSIRLAADIDTTGNSSVTGSYLLDMTPDEQPWDGRLAFGSTFVDPSGLQISAVAAEGGRARVRVQVPNGSGAPTCLDGTPFENGGGNASLLGSWTTGTSHPAEPGNDRALVVTVHIEGGATVNDLSAVTYGTKPMTEIRDAGVVAGGFSAYTAVYVLKEADIAAASSATIGLRWTGSLSKIPTITSAFFKNVNQASLVGASAINTAASGNISTAALPNASGDIVIWAATNGSTSATFAPANAFREQLDGDGDGFNYGVAQKVASGSNETPSVVISGGSRSTMVGFVLRGGGGSGGGGGDATLLGSWTTGTSHAPEAGNNRALVVAVHIEGGATVNDLSAVRYDTKLMTQVADAGLASSGLSAYTALYVLNQADIAAATSATISLTWTGSLSRIPTITSAFFANINQASLVGFSAINTATSGNIFTAALPNASGDIVIWAVTNGNTTATFAPANGFSEQRDGDGDGFSYGIAQKVTTGINETPSVVISGGSRSALVGFVLRSL